MGETVFIDSIERYFPALCGMNRGLRQILRFCMVVYWILLPLVPTLAVALSMQLGYSLGGCLLFCVCSVY